MAKKKGKREETFKFPEFNFKINTIFYLNVRVFGNSPTIGEGPV